MSVGGISGCGGSMQSPKVTTPKTTTPTVTAPPQSQVSAGTDADGDHDGSTGPDTGEHGSLNALA